MAWKRACSNLVLATLAAVAFAPPAHAQGEPPAGDAPDTPPTGALPPTEPTAAPAPAPPPPEPSATAPPAAAPTTQPPPGYGQPPPPGYGEPPPPPAGEGYGYGQYGEPPPPPPEKEGGGFEMPPFSLRIDPFNWLLEGRLGVEAEVGILKFMSFELVPVFVVNERPPTLNLGSIDSTLRQKSNGVGALSGGQADIAFWLDGKALHGYVIRVGITNEAYTYRTEDDAGNEIDSVSHTERLGFFMFGSHARWGAFTIAGGIGLGIELNKQERCFPNGSTAVSQAKTSDCKNQLLIATTPDTQSAVDLNSPLHPISFMARFSLGVAFD
jgi:hypothetical protein